MPTEIPVRVIDALALTAIVFGEPEEYTFMEAIEIAALTAPALLEFEMANISVTKMRRFPAGRDAILERFVIQARYGLELVPVNNDAVIGLADETGLTAYDVSYLWLARKLDCQLVTLDKKLQAAAGPLAAP